MKVVPPRLMGPCISNEAPQHLGYSRLHPSRIGDHSICFVDYRLGLFIGSANAP
jgi:hypothetical protein